MWKLDLEQQPETNIRQDKKAKAFYIIKSTCTSTIKLCSLEAQRLTKNRRPDHTHKTVQSHRTSRRNNWHRCKNKNEDWRRCTKKSSISKAIAQTAEFTQSFVAGATWLHFPTFPGFNLSSYSSNMSKTLTRLGFFVLYWIYIYNATIVNATFMIYQENRHHYKVLSTRYKINNLLKFGLKPTRRL